MIRGSAIDERGRKVLLEHHDLGLKDVGGLAFLVSRIDAETGAVIFVSSPPNSTDGERQMNEHLQLEAVGFRGAVFGDIQPEPQLDRIEAKLDRLLAEKEGK